MIDPVAEIERLTAFANRQAGTDAERRAANHLKARLGRSAHTEPTLIHPRWYLAHLLHATLAIAGSVVATASAPVGTILVAAAALGTLGDLTGRAPAARQITGRRASQNVVWSDGADTTGTAKGALVLAAHYDTGRTGAAYGRLDQTRAALGRLLHRPIGPAEPFVYAILVLLLTSAARLGGLHGPVLAAVQFVPTVVLIVAVPFLVDFALSGPSPGANDNASGVATAIRLTERYAGALDHFAVTTLLTGAQEPGALGMRAWLKRHRKQLDPLTTIVLNIDEVGAGTVRYATKEGPLVALRQHPRLTRLCDQIRDEDAAEQRYRARPITARRAGDAYAARARGIPAITISCADPNDRTPNHHRATDTPENVDPLALDRAFRFCSELIELIDEEVGPDVTRTAAASSSADAQASFTPS